MSGLILADDLSGLLEVAATFHQRATHVCAVLGLRHAAEAESHETLAISTETRNSRPPVAAAAVREALRFARTSGRDLLFKKIDSTLRGPVTAEIAAVAEAFPCTRILFAPANPAAGRIVRGGRLCVNGVPVADTEFGRDPLSPVRSSSLAELIDPALRRFVIIPDVETQRDLDAAVQSMEQAGEPWLGVGSGGLARAIAGRRGRATVSLGGACSAEQVPSSPVLFVCGSAHGLNRAQAERLRGERAVALHEIPVGVAMDRYDLLEADLAAGRPISTLLQTRRGDSAVAAKTIVDLAARLVRGANVHRLFITGGETAYGLCHALGVTALRPIGELEPGLSLSLANSSAGALLLTIKPGGFGDATTWVKAYDRLRA